MSCILLSTFHKGYDSETNDLVLNTAFTLIKQQLKRDLSSWESETKKRIESGRKGGLATQSKRKQSEALLKDTKANQADTVNVTVNDTVNDNDNVTVNDKKKDLKRVERFAPPSVQEVWYYMQEKGLPATTTAAELSKKFVNHYTSNGWKVGKNKMIDWRAAVRSNWLKDNDQHKPQRDISKL